MAREKERKRGNHKDRHTRIGEGTIIRYQEKAKKKEIVKERNERILLRCLLLFEA